ncbi:cytosine permease [Brevibacillus choshinensis]|uniref:cytosine permease n=1 Tax=Brevibacillus choshinensis TaxID=54911 RepID=UPI002E22A874|nr:cytosine permease [Brevibacillus choshinensis]
MESSTTVVGAQSLNVIFAKFFPGYMTWGAGFDIFGLDFPTMLSYILLWLVTVLLFLGGMNILSVFSKYSSPVVYIFIIGAAIWAIWIAGGIGPIMEYVPAKPMENGLVFIACVSALVSNWAGPIVNIADLTQRAKTPRAPMIGLPIGMIVSYILFAITCIGLIVGTEIAFGQPIFNIVDAIGTLILPWKLVSSTETLYLFYSFIGSMYGPIAGIMLSSYYIERKRRYNVVACTIMAISFILPMSGAFLKNAPLLSTLNQFAFFSGLILSFVLYTLCHRMNKPNGSVS